MFDWIDPQTKAFLKDQAKGQLRHIMTWLGGALGSYGLFSSSDQQAQFVTISTGLVIGGAGQLWSWWQKTGKGQMQARLVDIAAAAELKRRQAGAAHVAAAAADAKAQALLAEAQGHPLPPTEV